MTILIGRALSSLYDIIQIQILNDWSVEGGRIQERRIWNSSGMRIPSEFAISSGFFAKMTTLEIHADLMRTQNSPCGRGVT